MFEKWRHNGWLNYGGSILCDVCVSVFMHAYIFLYGCPPMHTCEHVHDRGEFLVFFSIDFYLIFRDKVTN